MSAEDRDNATDSIPSTTPTKRLQLDALGLLLESYDKALRALRDAVVCTLQEELVATQREIRHSLYFALLAAAGVGLNLASPDFNPYVNIAAWCITGGSIGSALSSMKGRREIRNQLSAVPLCP